MEKVKELRPDVALIDIGMLDKLQPHNRLEAVQYARERKLLKKK